MDERAIHSVAWLVWAGAVVVALTITRNPLYLSLVLAIVLWVRAAHAVKAADQEQRAEISLVWFSVVVLATSALFNVLMVHVGDHILFVVPEAIPLVGGALTLEALLFGLFNGLVLIGLFAAFSVLNRVLPVRAMLRLTPRAYYPAAVVMAIAVTFAPTALQQVQQVREAQAVRGHRVRGTRSWLPLIIPLLEGSLERSMQLAEAMMARGFASGEAPTDRRPQSLMLTGLIALVVGWLLQFLSPGQAAGPLLLVAGALLFGVALFAAGRQHPYTVYHPERWHVHDYVVIAGACVTTLVYLATVPGFDRSSLFYYPYPALTWPGFSPLVGLGTAGLAIPALIR